MSTSSARERFNGFTHDTEKEQDERPQEVEIVFWEPTGWGESSMGHVSSRIDGTMYSWGPQGMAIEPAERYMTRNDFRNAIGRKLRLTRDEAAIFEEYMRTFADSHKYGVVDANCADPAEEAFELLGYPMGIRPFPADLRQGIDQLKLANDGGHTVYPADPEK